MCLIVESIVYLGRQRRRVRLLVAVVRWKKEERKTRGEREN